MQGKATPTDPEGATSSPLKLALWIYLLLFLALGALAWQRPTWEWDLLGYLGCLEEAAGAAVDEAHPAVRAQIGEHAPPKAAEELFSRNEYRQSLSRDSQAFDAQLPFYRGRVVYLWSLRGLSALGLPPIHAAYLLSILAGLLLAIVMYAWLARHLPPFPAALLSATGLLAAGYFEVSTLATPDMLATSLLVAGAWCLLGLRRPRTAIILFLLALGARADHAVLIVPLLLWAALGDSESTGLSLGALGIALALIAATLFYCTAGRESYGWWTVYHHTFFGYKSFPSTETPAPDLALAVEHGLKSLPQFKAWQPLGFMVLGIVALRRGYRRGGMRNPALALAAIAMAALIAHFSLLPVLWPRLMLPYWTLIWVALVLTPVRPSDQPRSDQASP